MNKLFEIFYIIKFFWNVLKKRRKIQILLLILLNLFSSVFEILSIASIMPFISAITDTKYFLNTNLVKEFILYTKIKSVNLIFIATITFIVLNILSGIIRLIAQYINVRISFIAGSDIGQELFRVTLMQNYEYHTKTNSSNLISLISSKAGTIITNGVSPSINLINSFFLFIIIITSLIYINPKITLIIIFFLALVYFVIILCIRPIINRESINTSEHTDKTMLILQESFGGIREILLTNSRIYQINKYSISERKLRDSQSISGVISSFPRFIIEPVGMILLASIAYYLYSLNDSIGESLSLLVVITVALQRLIPVLQQIFSNWSSLANSKASLKDVVDQLKLKSTYLDSNKKDNFLWFKSIILKNIFFKYETRPNFILQNAFLQINKGEIVGIIGESGTGKSTTIDILSGLLKPTEGFFLIDENPIYKELDFEKWRNSIAVVSQRIFLTDSTLKENIAFGVPLENIDYDRLEKSINIANLSNTIKILPNGIDTILGERGIQISGGQLQRIAIARAFYKKASVLILDEFTSSLDTKTEDEILNSINQIKHNFTIIIVSHKKSNLKICERVYEVKDTKIIKIK